MQRIIYMLLFIFLNLNQMAESKENNIPSVPNGYCVFKELPYGNQLGMQILINAVDCQDDNNSKAIVRLILNKNGKHEIIKETNKALPEIKSNNEYIFEGERDIRLKNGFLEIEIAQPNRIMAEAYSFIFLFEMKDDSITFFDYKISDLCYISQEELCPRANKVREDEVKHQLARKIFYGKPLFDFDTKVAYEKIYNLWQGVENEVMINTNKIY